MVLIAFGAVAVAAATVVKDDGRANPPARKAPPIASNTNITSEARARDAYEDSQLAAERAQKDALADERERLIKKARSARRAALRRRAARRTTTAARRTTTATRTAPRSRTVSTPVTRAPAKPKPAATPRATPFAPPKLPSGEQDPPGRKP